MPDESTPLNPLPAQNEGDKVLDAEEHRNSSTETAEALLALSLESEVPAERAQAVQALKAASKDEAGNVEDADETAKTDVTDEDEWVELYGIDEEYAQMVRETLGESAGADGKKSHFREEFQDDE